MIADVLANKKIDLAQALLHGAQEGALNIAADAVLKVAGTAIKTLNPEKLKNIAGTAIDYTPLLGFAKRAKDGNKAAAQKLIDHAIPQEAQADLKALESIFGAEVQIGATKTSQAQSAIRTLESKLGSDSYIVRGAKSLYDTFAFTSQKQAQKDFIRAIRADESGNLSAFLSEAANASPVIQKNLLDILHQTSQKLAHQLGRFDLPPSTIKDVFDNFEKGTKQSYTDAIEQILLKVYDESYTTTLAKDSPNIPSNLSSQEAARFNTDSLEAFKAKMEKSGVMLEDSAKFLRFVESTIYNPKGVTFETLNNAQKTLNTYYKQASDPNFRSFVKDAVNGFIKRDIQAGIEKIFAQNAPLYNDARTLFDTALSDYATMKETLKLADSLKIRDSRRSYEQVAQSLSRFFLGQGDNIPNFEALLGGLQKELREQVELKLLQDMLELSFVKLNDIKVLDSSEFFKRLEPLKGHFHSTSAKDFIKIAQDFHTLFRNDASIARSLSPATTEKIGTSIATTLEGAVKFQVIKALFANIIRLMPYIPFAKRLNESVQGSALRYQLKKALDSSLSVGEFKLELQARAIKGDFTNATREQIAKILGQVENAQESLERVPAQPSLRADENAAPIHKETPSTPPAETQAQKVDSSVEHFGQNFSEYKGQGAKAVEKVLQERSGQVQGAFYRDELGEIDVVWGEITDPEKHKGYGLAHILDKRKAEFMQQGLSEAQAEAKAIDFTKNEIANIIENGKITNKPNEATKIETPAYKLILKQNWKGEPLENKWLVTAYIKNEKGESISSTPFTKGDNLPLNSSGNSTTLSPLEQAQAQKQAEQAAQENLEKAKQQSPSPKPNLHPIDSQEAKELAEHFHFKGAKPLVREARENEIAHALKSHGDETTEAQRGNIAITRADIETNYPKITQEHDEKFYTDTGVIYVKQVNGHHIVIEEALLGQDKLIFKTMWKTKGNYNKEVLLKNAKASPYLHNADEAAKSESISSPSLEQGSPLQSHQSTSNSTTLSPLEQAQAQKQAEQEAQEAAQQAQRQADQETAQAIKDKNDQIQNLKDSRAGKGEMEREVKSDEPIAMKRTEQPPTSIATDDNNIYQLDFVIVKARDVKPNFNADGLQPRTQKEHKTIESIAQNFKPEMVLGRGGYKDLPIIAKDGQVITGNHRVQGFKDFTQESRAAYERAIKDRFNIELASDELLLRTPSDDLSVKELLSIAYNSNKEDIKNLGDHIYSVLGRYAPNFAKLPRQLESTSVQELKSKIARILDNSPYPDENGANLALLANTIKADKNANITEMLNAFSKLDKEDADKTLSTFTDTAGLWHILSNNAVEYGLKQLDLRPYLLGAMYKSAVSQHTTRAANFKELNAQIKHILDTTDASGSNMMLEIMPNTYDNLIADLLGASLARFMRLENPSSNLYEALKGANSGIREQLAPRLDFETGFTTGKNIEQADIFDFIEYMIRQGEGGKEVNEAVELLPKLREKYNAFKGKDSALGRHSADLGDSRAVITDKVTPTLESPKNHESPTASPRILETESTPAQKSLFDTQEAPAETPAQKVDSSVDMPKKSQREQVKQQLQSIKNIDITHKSGIVARLSSTGIDKMLSDKAIQKSLDNGFSQEQHFSAVADIERLFKNSDFSHTEAPKNQSADIVGIHRYINSQDLQAQNAQALITLKESIENGNRIYSVELEGLTHPSSVDRSPKSKGVENSHHDDAGATKAARLFENPSDTIPQKSLMNYTLLDNNLVEAIGQKIFRNYNKPYKERMSEIRDFFSLPKEHFTKILDKYKREVNSLEKGEIYNKIATTMSIDEITDEITRSLKIKRERGYAAQAEKYLNELEEKAFHISKILQDMPYQIRDFIQNSAIDYKAAQWQKLLNTLDRLITRNNEKILENVQIRHKEYVKKFKNLATRNFSLWKNINALLNKEGIREVGDTLEVRNKNILDSIFKQTTPPSTPTPPKDTLESQATKEAPKSLENPTSPTATPRILEREAEQAPKVDSSVAYTDTQGHTHQIPADIAQKWLETFGLKDLQEPYTPQFSEQVAQALEPILQGEQISLSANSLVKLMQRDRLEFLPYIKETLEAPNAVVRQVDGALIFAKDYRDEKLGKFFASVSKNDKGEWIISSNAPKNLNNLHNKIKEGGKVLYSDLPELPIIAKPDLTAKALNSEANQGDIIPQSHTALSEQAQDHARQILQGLRKTAQKPLNKLADEVPSTDRKFMIREAKYIKQQAKEFADNFANLRWQDLRSAIRYAKVPYDEAMFKELKESIESREFARFIESSYPRKPTQKSLFDTQAPAETPAQKVDSSVESTPPKDTLESTPRNPTLESTSTPTPSQPPQAQRLKEALQIPLTDDRGLQSLAFGRVGSDAEIMEQVLIPQARNAYRKGTSQNKLEVAARNALKKHRQDLEQSLNITPIKEFGTNYAEHYHSGESAIQKLLLERNGQVAGAFYREELGDIDLVWGEVQGSGKEAKGWGLAKIIEKHGDEFENIAKELDEIIRDGEVVKTHNGYNIELGDYKVGLNIGWNENGVKIGENKWVVTAFDKSKLQSEKQGSNSASFTKGETLPLNSSDIIPQTTQAKQSGKSVAETKELIDKNKELKSINTQKIQEAKEKIKQLNKESRDLAYNAPATKYLGRGYTKTRDKKYLDYRSRFSSKLKENGIYLDYMELKKLKQDTTLKGKAKKEAMDTIYLRMYENMQQADKEVQERARAFAQKIREEELQKANEWLEKNKGASSDVDYEYKRKIAEIDKQLDLAFKKNTKDTEFIDLMNRQRGTLTYAKNGDLGVVRLPEIEKFYPRGYPMDLKVLQDIQKEHNYTDKNLILNGRDFSKSFEVMRAEIEARIGIKPIKEFGINYAEHYHSGETAIAKLLNEKQGQVAGAFYREGIGDITLAWGEKGTGKSDGWGLAKIAEYHPEVLDKLDKLIQDLPIVKETENRYKLDNGDFFISIRKDFDGEKQNWVIDST